MATRAPLVSRCANLPTQSNQADIDSQAAQPGSPRADTHRSSSSEPDPSDVQQRLHELSHIGEAEVLTYREEHEDDMVLFDGFDNDDAQSGGKLGVNTPETLKEADELCRGRSK